MTLEMLAHGAAGPGNKIIISQNCEHIQVFVMTSSKKETVTRVPTGHCSSLGCE